MVVTRTSPGEGVPETEAVHEAGSGVPAEYVPALAGSSEHASVNVAPAPTALNVTTAALLMETTSPFNGRPEYASGAVVALTAAAIPAAIVSTVSPAATW